MSIGLIEISRKDHENPLSPVGIHEEGFLAKSAAAFVYASPIAVALSTPETLRCTMRAGMG